MKDSRHRTARDTFTRQHYATTRHLPEADKDTDRIGVEDCGLSKVPVKPQIGRAIARESRSRRLPGPEGLRVRRARTNETLHTERRVHIESSL